MEITAVNAQLASLLQVKNSGLWTDEMKLSYEKLINRKTELFRKQKRLAKEQERKKKARSDFKRALTEVSEENPDVGKKLKKCNRQKIGRPSLQEDQPQLLKTIVDIVSAGVGISASSTAA